MAETFEVFRKPVFDQSLVSAHEHTHKPYGSPAFQSSDEIRIPIHFQDLVLDISNSYIYIEGTFRPKVEGARCWLSHNALAFLFDEIRYEMGGEIVTLVKKPGVTTLLKTTASYTALQKDELITSGWGMDETHQHILDKTSNIFSGKLPLKFLMGFAEDYPRAIINVPQELILIITRNNRNCYEGDSEADLQITKIEWKIKHLVPSDEERLNLMSRIQKNPQIKIVFRTWDLYELPAMRETTTDVWAIKTATNLEKPRFVVIGFQKNTWENNIGAKAWNLTSADISSIRLYLNSLVFPYERWNLDFDKGLYAPAYYAFLSFQNSYYGRSSHTSAPLISFSEFKKLPIFIIDCSHQGETVKTSHVDIKLEFEARKSFTKDLKVFSLILHDSILNYNPLEGSVQKAVNL